MDIKERIAYIDQLLDEYKAELLKLYIEDYGIEYLPLIKERQENTIFLLESPPDVTYDFYKANSHLIAEEDFEQLKELKDDYHTKFKNLKEAQEERQFTVLSKRFGVEKEYSQKEELLTLARKYFPDLSESDRKREWKLWEDYRTDCEKIKVHPLEDIKNMDDFLYREYLDEKILHTRLLFNTVWGKQQTFKLARQVDFPFGFENTADMLFLEKGSVGMCSFYLANPSTIFVRVPLIEVLLEGYNPIQTLFHENRHSAEGVLGIGTEDDMYTLINDIRTEKNAMADYTRILQEPFVEEAHNPLISLYPYTDDFFEVFKQPFDYFAITNRVEEMEAYFGCENLTAYEDILQQIVEGSDLEKENPSKKRSLEQVKKLKKVASLNSIKKQNARQ